MIPPDQRCKKCSFKTGYYPLENYTIDQSYVSCYPKDSPPKNFYYDEYIGKHKLCYMSCTKCSRTGNSFYHYCTVCEHNYIFIDEKPDNCYPKCSHYYYFDNLGNYKCTTGDECPIEYPFLILQKKKCTDDCYKDTKYKKSLEYNCFEQCPKGSKDTSYKFNGKQSIKCIENKVESECELNLKIYNVLKEDEITGKLLEKYVKLVLKNIN